MSSANAGKANDKDTNDLEAVTGNAEDDIGDLVASVRERELLYGEDSLLAVYGAMIAHICSAPKAYKVSLRGSSLLVRLETHSRDFSPRPSGKPLSWP